MTIFIRTFTLLFLSSLSFANTPPLCSKLSDNFCQDLWSSQHNGNLKTPYSTFTLGRSSKSNLFLVEKRDIQALIESAHRFPSELSKNRVYMNLIKKIQQHMKRENPSKLWQNQLTSLYTELNLTLDLIVQETFEKKYPSQRNKPEKDYSPEDWFNYVRVRENLYSAIIRTKIEKTPEWKRVQENFTRVKIKMFTVIEDSKLPHEAKEKLKSHLQEVQLSFPFTDSDVLGADASCSKNDFHAFYSRHHKKLTICAGHFYGHQSDAALTKVLAHELAHALDVSELTMSNFRDLPVGKALTQLLNHEGPITSCQPWNELLSQGAWDDPKKVSLVDHAPFQSLKSCLINKKDLRPLTYESLLHASQFFVDDSISIWARNQTFSMLATPMIYRNGAAIKNPFYLRPDLKVLRDNGYSRIYKMSDAHPTLHFFVYNLICEKGKEGPRELSHLSDAERKNLFETSIQEARRMSVNHLFRVLENCGDECYNLVKFNLARPSAENFADWLAAKVITLVLRDLPSEQRPHFVKEMGAILCDWPEYKYDTDFITTEKSFSRQTHDNNHLRRWSLFTPEIAKEIGCAIDEEKGSKLHQCKLKLKNY